MVASRIDWHYSHIFSEVLPFILSDPAGTPTPLRLTHQELDLSLVETPSPP
jgi:hypothetical protein